MILVFEGFVKKTI